VQDALQEFGVMFEQLGMAIHGRRDPVQGPRVLVGNVSQVRHDVCLIVALFG
jgi:hypothetical protein